MKRVICSILAACLLLAGCSEASESMKNSDIISSNPANDISSALSALTPSSSSEIMEITHSSSLPELTAQLYDVLQVTDGSTLEINYNGTREKVRLLMVDIPQEPFESQIHNELYRKTVHEYSKNLLDGKKVSLEFDQLERNAEGHLQAYVYIGEVMLNRLLISEGHAALNTLNSEMKYTDDFKILENEAKTVKRGLWADRQVQENVPPPTNINSTLPQTAEEQPVAAENISMMVWIPRTGKKYHSHSGCSNMKNPSEVSEQEAINMGFGKCKKCW